MRIGGGICTAEVEDKQEECEEEEAEVWGDRNHLRRENGREIHGALEACSSCLENRVAPRLEGAREIGKRNGKATWAPVEVEIGRAHV